MILLANAGVNHVDTRYFIRNHLFVEIWRMLPRDLKKLMEHVVGACDVIFSSRLCSSSSHVGRDPQSDPSPPPSPSAALTVDIASTSRAHPP